MMFQKFQAGDEWMLAKINVHLQLQLVLVLSDCTLDE
jgi:hypothetical protein